MEHNLTHNIKGTACVKGNQEGAQQAGGGEGIRDGERGCKLPSSLRKGQKVIGESESVNKGVRCLLGMGLPQYPHRTPHAVIGRKQPRRRGLSVNKATDFKVGGLGGTFSWLPHQER